MIARIQFVGIIKKEKKSTLEDHVDIHANDLKEAREIFSSWTKGAGIRGASGVFHPFNGYGDVRIKTVTEVTKTGDLDIREIEELEEESVSPPEEETKPKTKAADLEPKKVRPTGSKRSTQPTQATEAS